MPKVHIGKKIKEVLDRSALSVVDFAKNIGLTRNGAYKVFEKETIDTGQLQKIGTALGHDFFNHYHNVASSVNEPEEKIHFVTATELAQSNRELLSEVKAELQKLREELFMEKKSYKASGKTSKNKIKRTE